MLVANEKRGLGGAMKFLFRCNGCWTAEIGYQSSQLAAESRRHLVSLALSLAFFISGHNYASYRKTLGKGLGLGVLSDKPFIEIIDLAYPHIKGILNEMCEREKDYESPSRWSVGELVKGGDNMRWVLANKGAF